MKATKKQIENIKNYNSNVNSNYAINRYYLLINFSNIKLALYKNINIGLHTIEKMNMLFNLNITEDIDYIPTLQEKHAILNNLSHFLGIKKYISRSELRYLINNALSEEVNHAQ